jgi:long-chain acyl-CoA synthetase
MTRTSGLMTYLDSLGDVARFSADSVSLGTLPLFHIGGIGWVLAGLNRGSTTVMLRDTGGDDVVRAAEQDRATILIAVPSVIRTILDAPTLPHADLESLETLYYGGGPVTQQVLDEALAALKCDLVQGFGLTECPLVTALPPEDHAVELLASCGRAIPGTEVRVVDPDTGTEAPTGSVGELWVRSPQTMAGYWRQPEATAAALVDGGWLRTGDAARMDEAGHVFMADRLKDMIVTGGENVYPAEVENVLARHPAVGACAVIGVPSRRWTEAVAAVVVLRAGHEATAEDLIDHCRGFLAGYKRPKSVVFVEELPRTPAGKVLKYQLKAEHRGSGD